MAPILASIVGAYLLVCFLAFLFQRRMTYFPLAWSEVEARRANPGYEEVRIPAAGAMLHGWLDRRKDSPWTVVIFHGNAGNLMFHEAAMSPFRALGLQQILFDYRGYGLSEGSPSEEGLVGDGEAVMRYVEESLGVPRERIVFFGQSLGAGVATLLASRHPPGRLILQSAFDSLVSVAGAHYPFLPAEWLMRDRYDAAAVIGRVSCPILFLHPAEDEIIPISLGRALLEKALKPKRFVEIPGARHNDPPDSFPPLYREAIREFLSLRD